MAEQEEEKKEKKPRKFNWFGLYSLDGKGVDKNEKPIIEEPTFGNFFKLFGRIWTRLISLNLMFIFGNFPIFFYLIYKAGYFGVESTAPYYQNFIPLYGVNMFGQTPVTQPLYGIFGMQVPINANTPATVAFLFLTGLALFTFGPVNAGITYILRGFLRGDPVFLWSDFWHAIKKNYKQAIPMGIIDLLAVFMLGYDISFFLDRLTSWQMYIMLYLSMGMFVIFFIMRFYIYHIMITFDLKLRKIFKNALIFTILGIKRNILGLIGCVVVIAVNYSIFSFYIPVGIVLPFIFTAALIMYIETYTAYPKIKEYMIDPYYGENGEASSDGSDGDAPEAAE